MGIVNGVRYRVVIVVSGLTVGSANYTLGGTTGGSTLSANGTYTDNVVAGSTANIIITPTNTSRFTIDSVSVKTADVTHSIPIGVVGVDGYRLDRFWVTTGTLLTPDGMNYYTFKPWVSRPAVNGGMEKVYLGTPRSTLTLALAAGQPLRMHDEQYLGAQVPKFSTVGVDVVVTGTPASATLLVRPLFQADFSVI